MVMATNERPAIDYSNKDYSALRQALLELAREKLPEWTDHSPNDLGVVLLELFAYAADIQLYYQDRIANESYLETAVERRSIVNLLRLIGCELRPPQPASADLTLLFNDVNATVTLAKGTEFQTTAKTGGQSVSFRYVRDELSIVLNKLPLVNHPFNPTDKKLYRRFETLPVIQVDTLVTDEIVGSSDGSPGQRFALARTPLIGDSLTLSVSSKTWLPVATLLYSRADYEHYVVRRDESGIAWIEFGDGRYGNIPPRGHTNITACYLAGGGAKGNVPPNTIVATVATIEHLKWVYNGRAAAGGLDAETTQEAVLRGPAQFRAMGRAVTARDYEAYAKSFGVGKVRARAAGWNRVELVVAPAGGGYPSDTLKEDLRNYFEDKRVISSIVEIVDPRYVNVYVAGVLQVEPYYYSHQVKQRVENAIKHLLAFDQVDFECSLYISKFYEAIEAIEGVAWVNIDHFALHPYDPPGLLPEKGRLAFNYDEIPQAGYAEGIFLREVQGGRSAG